MMVSCTFKSFLLFRSRRCPTAAHRQLFVLFFSVVTLGDSLKSLGVLGSWSSYRERVLTISIVYEMLSDRLEWPSRPLRQG